MHTLRTLPFPVFFLMHMMRVVLKKIVIKTKNQNKLMRKTYTEVNSGGWSKTFHTLN